ncbi:GIY-YIG nuclease family protein [Patescibacteria group bacterium]|nr:GIY-YIG nuclease family protein [Patescibacteria group bacterium]MBU1890462.1 GIY-YIG nuclease family protein [Patescibacteria group bacterium]
MYCVYFIRSIEYKRVYIGSTNDYHRRILEHNNNILCKSTKPYQPWKMVRIERFQTRSDARKRENFLKRLKNRKVIDNIIGDPDVSSDQRSHQKSESRTPMRKRAGLRDSAG